MCQSKGNFPMEEDILESPPVASRRLFAKVDFGVDKSFVNEVVE